jgi:hypothetical protein
MGRVMIFGVELSERSARVSEISKLVERIRTVVEEAELFALD